MPRTTDLTLVEAREILHEDCKYCGQPFWYESVKDEAIEVDGGSYYLHKSCAKEFGQRLLEYAK